MSELSISNIVNVSVSATPSGASEYNTSNLALFTNDVPDPVFSSGYKIYLDPNEVGLDFGTDSATYKMALVAFSQQPNFLAPGGYLVVITMNSAETLDEAVTRTIPLVSYFGFMSAWIESDMEATATAAVAQANNLIYFFVSKLTSSLTVTTGVIWKFQDASQSHARGLYYGGDGTDIAALKYKAGYAGRALSTIFEGSNTTATMNLKSIISVPSDQTVTQTVYDNAEIAGADIYPSIRGVACVISNGANQFFDQVYNLLWFVGAIQIAGFNYLRQTGQKVPQTENGMSGLKGAYAQVCVESVNNGYVAPGVWLSPVTFGNQQDLLDNIKSYGYYIYSTPIAQQTETDREAREAPICQIAIKEAGAFHKSTVIIYVNA